MKIIFALLLVCATSCMICGCRDRAKDSLISAVQVCIDSGEIPEKFVQVIERDYGDYSFYYIFGNHFVETYDSDTLQMPSDIFEYKDKYILWFRLSKSPFSVEEVRNKLHAMEDSISEDAPTSWSYLYDKSQDTGMIIRNEIKETAPFEVPLIRDKLRKGSKNPIDIVCVYEIVLRSDMNFVLGVDSFAYFPYRFSSYMAVYNRTDSCLIFDPFSKRLGRFGLLHQKDTLFMQVEEGDPYYKRDTIIKQKTKMTFNGKYYNYNRYSEEYGTFYIKSLPNDSFFKNIPQENYYKNVYSILVDSLYYFPNVEEYQHLADEQYIYPTERIKVYMHPYGEYRYVTKSASYVYRGDSLVNIWHRNAHE